MKSILHFLITSLIIIPGIVTAQEMGHRINISCFAGAAIPQGEFGKTTGEKSGFAETGFCGLMQASVNVAENINSVTSVSLAFNSVNESEMENQLQGFTVSAGNYVTTWALTGIGFQANTSPTVKFFAMAQIGLLVSNFPDITLSSGGESITQTTKTATAFAYGFGTGISFNRVSFSLRYFAGEPEYTETATNGGRTYTAKVKLPTAILSLMIGYNL